VDEASSVDAVPAPAGPEDPSNGSVAEGATGVTIGEGTTTVVSGTEDPGEVSVSRGTEERVVSAPNPAPDLRDPLAHDLRVMEVKDCRSDQHQHACPHLL
jgi:hypothetical protein